MATLPDQTFSATIARLGRPGDLRALDMKALHVVMAVRLCALFDRAEREPLAELAQRFRSFEAAAAVLDLVRTVSWAWPEPFTVNRPCCLAMSPDETTLAAMLRAAARGDRAGFGEVLAGFVRPGRHERLYDAGILAAATLAAAHA